MSDEPTLHEQWHRWTLAEPTVSGYYYIRGWQSPAEFYQVVFFDADDNDISHHGGITKLHSIKGHSGWAGPIPEPIDTEKEVSGE